MYFYIAIYFLNFTVMGRNNILTQGLFADVDK